MEIAKLTIKQASKLLQEKKLTCQELTRAVLANIDQKEQEINAFITLEGDLALLQAQKCDERLSRGQRLSEIDGVPLAIKDNILIKGLPCTAGSKILENFIAPYDATVIKKLKNA
ncbi:MAG: Asp-tRNA(Asn)/Glu-tRNA(Gln) amidotransferase GatCAB subunit A, partial [Candidatus Nealsonbacteria bacterium CG23_combo_of_CG06-09_8_20_14_all_40_13]